ncbi:hypothetical protein BZA70DRAFT_277153 [Myxozyma melibiosi]|uniref:RING-type domain-containing protein n=1 Tax=Myxozyma melibiosi TaxID=54550 RepID=A0ABR1F9J7_9ASCO
MDHNNNNNNTSSNNGASQPQSPPTFPPNVFYVNYHFTFAPSPTAPATPSPGFPPPATDDAAQSPQQQQQQQGPANPFQGFFFYTIPGGAPVAGQAGPDNNPFEFFEEPPKPRASKNAVAALKDVDLDAIPEADRTCSICFEPYSAGKNGPKQAESKCAHDEEHDDEAKATADAAATESAAPADEKKAEAEDDHAPLQMPCGHIFGRSCLKEWLASSTTCPLCRTAIEAEAQEAQEPRQSAPRATFFFQNGLPFLVGPLFNIIAGARGARPAPASAQNPGQTGAGENASSESSSEATTQTPSGTTTASEESGASTPASQDQREPSISRSLSFTLSARNRNHPYLRRSAPSSSTNLSEPPTVSTTASSTPSSTTLPPLATVLARPDLECGSAPMGLCEESGAYMRLTCGHGFHEDCLRSAMRSHGDADIPNLRSDEDVSTSDIERPQVRREVWCMRCRRYVAVDV